MTEGLARVRVTLACEDLELEGALQRVPGSTEGAVVCHPHPQYGGDMDNPVVCAVASALHQAGWATLRFNFRGVGTSTGSYGGGRGEMDDVRAAVRYLCEQTGIASITLAGYSFGAVVALQVGASLPQVDRLIAIAPPLDFFDFGCLAACIKEKLFVVGDQDQYCSSDDLVRRLADVAQPKGYRVLAGADHFFGGRQQEVADAVRELIHAR